MRTFTVRSAIIVALAALSVSAIDRPQVVLAQAERPVPLASEKKMPQPELPQPQFGRQKRFQFPINVDPAAVGIAGVQLHASVDRGASWRLYSELPAYAKSFDVEVLRDGEYWFSLKTVDTNNNVRPANETRVASIVIIDSRPPQIQLSAETTADGQVKLKWQVTDPNLDPATFTVGYQSGIGNSFQKLAVDPHNRALNDTSIGGEHQWSPEVESRVLTIRVEVWDRAKNRGVVTRRLFFTRTTKVAAKKEPAAGLNGNDANAAAPSQIGEIVAPLTQTNLSPVPWPADNQLPSHDRAPPQPGSDTHSVAPSETAEPGVGKLASDQHPADESAAAAAADDTPASSANGPEPEAEAETPAEPSAADREPKIPPGEPLRMTQSRRFHLEYDIESLGPDAVREVQLWGTQDGGATWEKWNIDRDLQSPFDVQVNDEGLYGFRVVIVAANGLAGELPAAGSAADLWVGYDATPPTAEISDVLYGSGPHLGQLEIRWTAADRQLGERPIRLSFSETGEGPWTTIAAGLPNSGQYFWEIDRSVPKQVYVRLECFDEAGNSVQHVIQEPVNTAGVFPRARIRAVQPVAPHDQKQ